MPRKGAAVGLAVALSAAAIFLSAFSSTAEQPGETTPCEAIKTGFLPEGSLCVPDGTGSRVVAVGPVNLPCERAPAPAGADPTTCLVLEEYPTSVGSNALLSYTLTNGGEMRVLVAAGGNQIVFDSP